MHVHIVIQFLQLFALLFSTLQMLQQHTVSQVWQGYLGESEWVKMRESIGCKRYLSQ